MARVGEWLYRYRDRFSYGMAGLVMLLALLPRPVLQSPPTVSATEIRAMLEEPPRPKEEDKPDKPDNKPDKPDKPDKPPKVVDQNPLPKPMPRELPQEQPRAVTMPQSITQPVDALRSQPVIKEESQARVARQLVEPVVEPAPKSAEPVYNPVQNARYEEQVLASLERAKRYPSSREARLTRPQGTVRVWLEINRAGQLMGTGLIDSSGSNLLDSAALHTVRSIAFPSFPEQVYSGQTSHRFVVNLKYEINSDE